MDRVTAVRAVILKRMQHFCRLRDVEMKNGKGERDTSWKVRTQYLQGRVQGLEEALQILGKGGEP